MRLHLQSKRGDHQFEVRQVAIAGFTGRNQADVKKHIDELAEQGIGAPDSVPTLYRVDPQLLTTAPLVVAPGTSSGEAEPVLLFTSDSLDDALVAVGSDITDRELEKESIERSKATAKPLSTQVWEFSEVADQWDALELRSWTSSDRSDGAYQDGKLESLLSPESLLELLAPRLNGSLAGTALYMGTLPLQRSGFAFTPYFGCELRAPSGGDVLECSYRLQVE